MSIRTWVLIGVGLVCWPYFLSLMSLISDWLCLFAEGLAWKYLREKTYFIMIRTSMVIGALIIIICLVLRFF